MRRAVIVVLAFAAAALVVRLAGPPLLGWVMRGIAWGPDRGADRSNP